MIGCVALTPTLLHAALPAAAAAAAAVALSLPISLTLSVSRTHTSRTLYIFRLRSDTCSDPRKCDFEPGISWRRLKNKTLLLLLLLLPPLLPLPLLLLQLHLQSLLLALAPGPVECGMGWIICYDDYADAAAAASRPWGGCWRAGQAQIITTQRQSDQPNHPTTHLPTHPHNHLPTATIHESISDGSHHHRCNLIRCCAAVTVSSSSSSSRCRVAVAVAVAISSSSLFFGGILLG